MTNDQLFWVIKHDHILLVVVMMFCTLLLLIYKSDKNKSYYVISKDNFDFFCCKKLTRFSVLKAIVSNYRLNKRTATKIPNIGDLIISSGTIYDKQCKVVEKLYLPDGANQIILLVVEPNEK